jgi:3-phosphoshikimate 1-carboxyvinyltransferase
MSITLHPTSRLSGNPIIPGDKSISHRALLFGGIAQGITQIKGLLESEDVFSTWKSLENMGIQISKSSEQVHVFGKGKYGLKKPAKSIDCGNSGTTMRLLIGILSGQPFETTLTGDSSLSKRPMRRIADPLTQMGARFELRENNFSPVQTFGNPNLRGILYDLPTPSAQLKSALLLAGLYANGKTSLGGKVASRDHTERLLPHFGVQIEQKTDHISIEGNQALHSASVQVPSDFSSAAFWLTAAAIIPESILELQNISLNPSRIGFLQALRRMGADIETQMTSSFPEPIGTIRIRNTPLQATTISEEEVPSLIDEIPLIAVLACHAEGKTQVQGAAELRVKETDRIEAVAANLRAMGGRIETFSDGFVIEGPQILQGGKINSFHDHRIAMAFSIAALRAKGPTEILHSECISISYPSFYQSLCTLAYE